MPPADDGSWARLGEHLARRRAEIDPRYRNRTLFAQERNVNWRLVHDIERAKRTDFRPETLSVLEGAYELAPGAISRFLASGDLEAPLAGSEPRPVITVLPAAAVLPPSQAAEDLWSPEVRAAAEPYALKVAFRLLALRSQGIENPDGAQMFGGWQGWDDSRAAEWWDSSREDLPTEDLVWLVAVLRARRDRGVRRNSGTALPRLARIRHPVRPCLWGASASP